MTTEQDLQARADRRIANGADLDNQYRRIGISAVAAALPYKGDAKNPAYAPALLKSDDRFVAAA
ncbi:MAG TPA: hypothetical protein VFA53_11415 [Xanthobacteraceae bacterium]|nr:hypothetical protein [Xanthobacteraceae bacterium]